MLIKNLKNIPSFIAGDNSILKEVLHPKNDNINQGFSLAYAVVKTGEKTIPHKLKNSVEVYFILKGSGIMHIDNEQREVNQFDTIYIPPNSIQWIENTGREDLEFLCIVSPPWKKENEIVLNEILENNPSLFLLHFYKILTELNFVNFVSIRKIWLKIL